MTLCFSPSFFSSPWLCGAFGVLDVALWVRQSPGLMLGDGLAWQVEVQTWSLNPLLRGCPTIPVSLLSGRSSSSIKVGLCLLGRSQWVNEDLWVMGSVGTPWFGVCAPNLELGVCCWRSFQLRADADGQDRCWSWPCSLAQNSSLPTHPRAINNK